jgi:hypothetical protein
LRDEEIAEIEKAFPFIESVIPPEHRKAITAHGLVDGAPGNYATQCVDGKACVFVYYENGIAKCSFEKVYLEKKINWQKPLSCHLFPIRMTKDGKVIHYEYFSECEPALERGKKENISLHRFIEEPLKRAFRDEFTQRLNNQIEQQQSNNGE